MRRLVIALCLSLTLLATAASTVLALPVPAEYLPAEACENSARGRAESNAHATVPFYHTDYNSDHGCHVHYPEAYWENSP
jgi:hypothetical protein